MQNKLSSIFDALLPLFAVDRVCYYFVFISFLIRKIFIQYSVNGSRGKNENTSAHPDRMHMYK